MKTLAKLCSSCRIYGTCVFWYIHVKCTKRTCFGSKNTVQTHENNKQYCAFHGEYMVHVYFGIHVKCTKNKCFWSKNTVKTHENTSKTVHFM
jgi:hypothetical protein